MIKYISFDLDGTLVDDKFDELIWRREIPYLYAKKHGLMFDEAFKQVTTEYKKLWGKVNRWRDVSFWFEHFGLKEDWKDILEEVAHEIKVYPEVTPLLKKLHGKQKLIILSHAERKFLELKLKCEGLEQFFDIVFSTTSDLENFKKDESVYNYLFKKLNIKPEELIHIGDDFEFDFKIPNALGVRAIYLDRSGKNKGDNIVSSLKDINNIVTLEK